MYTYSILIVMLELHQSGPSLFGEQHLLVFQLLDLLFNDGDLGVENELLTFYFERPLAKFLEMLVMISTHLGIFGLE